MKNTCRIAVNAFYEALREPAFSLVLIAACLLITNLPALALFTFSDHLKLIIDSAMATTMLFGMVAGILAATGAVANEITNDTISLIMTKPVSRSGFIIGKMCGVGAAALVFGVICAGFTIITVYCGRDEFHANMIMYWAELLILAISGGIGLWRNYNGGKAFGESAIFALLPLTVGFTTLVGAICFPPKAFSALTMLSALLPVVLALATMATLAAALSAFLELAANLCVCTVIFVLGLISDYLFRYDTGSRLGNLLLRGFCTILPDWQFFWLADALSAGKVISARYILYGVIYLALYIVLAGVLACALFQRKETAGERR